MGGALRSSPPILRYRQGRLHDPFAPLFPTRCRVSASATAQCLLSRGRMRGQPINRTLRDQESDTHYEVPHVAIAVQGLGDRQLHEGHDLVQRARRTRDQAVAIIAPAQAEEQSPAVVQICERVRSVPLSERRDQDDRQDWTGSMTSICRRVLASADQDQDTAQQSPTGTRWVPDQAPGPGTVWPRPTPRALEPELKLLAGQSEQGATHDSIKQR